MSFVIPFFKERETFSNIVSPESDSEESNDEEISSNNDKNTNKDVLSENEESEQETTLKRNKVMGSVSQKTKSPKKMKMPASYYSNAKKKK